MSRVGSKKKYIIIRLILILIIVISVTVLLLGINREKPFKKEKLTEEEILDRCITAINEGDGKFLTYAETFYTEEQLEFLNYYNGLIDKYDYKKYDNEMKVEIAEFIGGGFVDKFKYLKTEFGEDYKITYNVISEEAGDVERYNSVIDSYVFLQNYGIDIEEHLSKIGASKSEIQKGTELYEKMNDFENEIEIDGVNILTVEFCVSGEDKEVRFKERIIYLNVFNDLIPCIQIADEEEALYTTFGLTPKFIYDEVYKVLENNEN